MTYMDITTRERHYLVGHRTRQVCYGSVSQWMSEWVSELYLIDAQAAFAELINFTSNDVGEWADSLVNRK